MSKRRRGRPRISARGSEVLSIRVPKGTAAVLKASFKVIYRLAQDHIDPASIILRAQLEEIQKRGGENPVLSKLVIDGISHVLDVIERNRPPVSSRAIVHRAENATRRFHPKTATTRQDFCSTDC